MTPLTNSSPCYQCKLDKPAYAQIDRLFGKITACSKKCLSQIVKESKTKIIAVHLNVKPGQEKKG